jgi:hypothetical protein
MSDDPTANETPQDIVTRLKHLAQPLVDSLDSRLRDQIDKRVDERVDTTLAARLSVIERAIADIDRTLRELQERLADD